MPSAAHTLARAENDLLLGAPPQLLPTGQADWSLVAAQLSLRVFGGPPQPDVLPTECRVEAESLNRTPVINSHRVRNAPGSSRMTARS
jgi:hypothetical protein